MDRGAALNCRVVHNWTKADAKKAEETNETEEVQEDNTAEN
jgi:hypothetical protein